MSPAAPAKYRQSGTQSTLERHLNNKLVPTEKCRMPQMKPASIPAFVPLLNAKRVNGICPNEIEKLLPIWIGINDNTIANAATIVPSTQTLFFSHKKTSSFE
jgi:hypothetical protein